ncbi:MAG: TolC family protein, partial [Elusimicrobia bacterium]|nr:TolC family protein [Candidatus Obscuribacterium magneticum]
MRFPANLLIITGLTVFLITHISPSLHAGAKKGGIEPPVSTPRGSLTLKQCYDLALQQSETLKISMEDIRQAEALYRQALGSILPDVTFNAQKFYEERGVISGGTALPNDSTTSKFVLTQPLFKGLKELSAMSGAKHQLAGKRSLNQRLRTQIYQDAAQAFYTVVDFETRRQNTRDLIRLTEDRVKELRARMQLGKSRESEVLQAESQLLAYEAADANTAGNISAARDLLSFLVGQDIRSTPLQSETEKEIPVLTQEEALGKSINRSDRRAAEEEALAQKYGVRVARAGYSPVLDLTGNYYLHREGLYSPVDWDLLFNLDVPLFQGGTVRADVEAARSRYEQARLTLSQLNRSIKKEIQQAFDQLQASLNQARILKEAYAKFKKSYQYLTRE